MAHELPNAGKTWAGKSLLRPASDFFLEYVPQAASSTKAGGSSIKLAS
jgi:hypothetical protein